MTNRNNTENNLTKVDTLVSSDLVRVVKSGSSRNMTLTDFVTAFNLLSANLVKSVVSSTTNITATSANDVILMDVTSGTLTVTLPAVSAVGVGKCITIKKTDSSTNDVTISGTGENIDGSATATLSGSGGAKPAATVMSTATEWFIIGS